MTKQIVAVVALMIAGCGENMARIDGRGQGGARANAGEGGGGGRGGSTAQGGAPASGDECAKDREPTPDAAVPITINTELRYAGRPVRFGEPFALEGGGTLTVTNFRFYVSRVVLRLRSGGELPADVVSADGAPAPYGVALVNAEDPSAMAVHLAAPAGDYSGLSFLLGIPDVCNGSDNGRDAPLSALSQLTWPAPFGYLFLRYAGNQSEETAPVSAVPEVIDMGGFPGHIFAPRIEEATDLRVESALTLRLTVALDQLFRASTLPADLDEYAGLLSSAPGSLGTAQLNGQHLLKNLGAVRAFTLSGLP